MNDLWTTEGSSHYTEASTLQWPPGFIGEVTCPNCLRVHAPGTLRRDAGEKWTTTCPCGHRLVVFND